MKKTAQNQVETTRRRKLLRSDKHRTTCQSTKARVSRIRKLAQEKEICMTSKSSKKSWTAFAILMVSVIVGVVLFFLVSANYPGLLLGLVGSVISIVSLSDIRWVIEGQISQLRNRTKLQILETFSDGKPRTQQQIQQMLDRDNILIRFFRPKDVLADLVFEGKVILVKGKYVTGDQRKLKQILRRKVK